MNKILYKIQTVSNKLNTKYNEKYINGEHILNTKLTFKKEKKKLEYNLIIYTRHEVINLCKNHDVKLQITIHIQHKNDLVFRICTTHRMCFV